MCNPPSPPVVEVRWLPVDFDGDTAGLDQLDSPERERRERLVFATDRRAYTAAHALLRDLLSEMAPVPPGAWHFVADSFGKPRLSGEQAGLGLTFNLTHSRGMVACAAARGLAVGIDVETSGSSIDIDELSREVLTAPECATLAASPDRTAAFLSFWTLREAYAKARGLGLSLPFQDYRAALSPPRIIPARDDPKTWSAWLERPDGAFLAVVAEGAPVLNLRRAEPGWLP